MFTFYKRITLYTFVYALLCVMNVMMYIVYEDILLC